MKTIYKYTLENDGTWEHKLPEGAKVLHSDQQISVSRNVQFWVELDNDLEKTEWRRFKLFATGEEIPEISSHISTILIGEFVFHLYEITPLNAN